MITAPKVLAVGYLDPTTAKLLIVAEGRHARLAARVTWQVNGQSIQAKEVILQQAAPFHMANTTLDLGGIDASADTVVAYQVTVSDKQSDFGSEVRFLPEVKRYSFRWPSAARALRIGSLSCNRQQDKFPSKERQFDMWKRLAACVQAGEVDLLIHGGDQIYADEILDLACTRGEMPVIKQQARKPASLRRRIEALATEYRKLYVDFWSKPDVQAVLTTCPSVMMWDDHDTFDGFGATSRDWTYPWRAFFEAAKVAYADFQAPICPEPFEVKTSWTFGVHHGETAVLVIDTRSNRDNEKGITLGNRQLDLIETWLANLAGEGVRHLYVDISKPVVFADSRDLKNLEFASGIWVKNDDDIREFWNYPKNIEELRRLLHLLYRFQQDNPSARVTILSGDLHIAYVAKLDLVSPAAAGVRRGGSIYEIVSSGIGTRPPALRIEKTLLFKAMDEQEGFAVIDGIVRGEVLPIQSKFAERDKVIMKRNFAIVESVATEAGIPPALKFRLFVEDQDQPTESTLA